MLGTETENEAIARHRVAQEPSPVTIQEPSFHNMKINQKTVAALKAAKAARISGTAVPAVKLTTKKDKSAKKSAKSKKADKAPKRAEYKGPTNRQVLHVQGSKGSIFRLVNIDKQGFAKLIQNNIGLSYDGPSVDLLASDKADKETRLHAAYYVCERGARPKIDVLSVEQAKALCKARLTVERGGKKIQMRVGGDLKNHYLPSYETTPKGADWFFQLETKRLPHNAKHFGALVKVSK